MRDLPQYNSDLREVSFAMGSFYSSLVSYAEQNDIHPTDVAIAIRDMYGEILAAEFLNEYEEWTS